MSDDITFLPWLRRGLAVAIEAVDPLTGGLAHGPEIAAWIELEDQRIERKVRLFGPDQVVGISADQILREEPRPDSVDVEPNYFPLVELAAADLPWMYTPAAVDSQGRLRPWLVLVTVREQEGVSLVQGSGSALPTLHVGGPAIPAQELPDLTDSWAWAHVQSLVPIEDVTGAVTGRTGEVFARIVSPRRLAAHASWLTCLVPAFSREGDDIRPAWDLTETEIELPVFHHWRFTTGAGGDFEALCRRLQPDQDEAVMGLHAMDVTDPGLVGSAPATVLVDMEGALQTLGATPRPWDADHRSEFEQQVVELVNTGAATVDVTPPGPSDAYDPQTQDPVVAPPMYGIWPAGATSLPEQGWLLGVNDHPARRGAAGLGALVVRTHQEALVAAAWDQAGDLQAATALLNRARLATEIGRSWTRRAGALADEDLLQLTGRLHVFVPDGAGTVRASLAESAVPDGLISTTFLRQTRKGTPLARDWEKRLGSNDARLSADHTRINLEATAGGPTAVALEFARVTLPAGAQVSDPTLTEVVDPPAAQSTTEARLHEIEGRLPVADIAAAHEPGSASAATPAAPTHTAGSPALAPTGTMEAPAPGSGPAPTETRTAPSAQPGASSPIGSGSSAGAGTAPAEIAPPPGPLQPGAPVTAPAGTDVTDLGAVIRAGLDPLAAVRSSVLHRVPGLETLIPADTIPTSVSMAPVFDDPLFWDLRDLSVDWILPGVDELGHNRVRLVEVNTSFVGSFLIGANHELARELLWRGYPVDLTATFFHRFWDYLDGRADIADLHTWDADKNIRNNIDPGDDTMTVIVVRGDLVRRYPTTRYFLQQAVRDEGGLSPVDGSVVDAAFLGALDRDTVFVGFDLDPEEVSGDPGWFLAIEEQVGAPRFGLDESKSRHFGAAPAQWNNLSWGHLVSSQAELDELTHASAGHPENALMQGHSVGGTTWGFNAAHMARACWQRPFRMLIHASTLI